jgi:hypothetical protein
MSLDFIGYQKCWNRIGKDDWLSFSILFTNQGDLANVLNGIYQMVNLDKNVNSLDYKRVGGIECAKSNGRK